jgi:hypothetical protein
MYKSSDLSSWGDLGTKSNEAAKENCDSLIRVLPLKIETYLIHLLLSAGLV